MMTKYFGMHPFKMYMKCKPINFYFKFWCLRSSTGYLHSFSPNLRKSNDFDKVFLGIRVKLFITPVIVSEKSSNHEVFIETFFQ